MNTSKIKLSLLVMDYSVYPRHKLSEYNITTLTQALEAGAKLPPIMWDKKTKVIIDGFHRVTAYQRKYGPDYDVEGEEVDCVNRNEIILRGAEINNKHGMKLQAWDLVRCLYIAEQNKIEKELMVKALSIPPERVTLLEKRIVEVRNEKGQFIGKTQLKHGQEKMTKKPDGIYVTQEEQKQIEGGTTGIKLNMRVRQLIKEFDMNNFEINSSNIESIKELSSLLYNAIKEYENG